MKICKRNAFRLWEESFGNARFAEDFHGNLMCKDSFGKANDYIMYQGEKILCGWNIHHIFPATQGGTNEKCNLICTNMMTNEEAGNKITYWIDDSLYQVRRITGTDQYEIVRLR